MRVTPRHPRQPLTEDQIRERDETILRLYRSGMLLKDIALEVGAAANRVGMILKKLGEERPEKPQKPRCGITYDKSKIVGLWNHGLSTSAISERLQVGHDTICAVLRESGIVLDGTRHRYDGEGGTIDRNGNAFARIAGRT